MVKIFVWQQNTGNVHSTLVWWCDVFPHLPPYAALQCTSESTRLVLRTLLSFSTTSHLASPPLLLVSSQMYCVVQRYFLLFPPLLWVPTIMQCSAALQCMQHLSEHEDRQLAGCVCVVPEIKFLIPLLKLHCR